MYTDTDVFYVVNNEYEIAKTIVGYDKLLWFAVDNERVGHNFNDTYTRIDVQYVYSTKHKDYVPIVCRTTHLIEYIIVDRWHRVVHKTLLAEDAQSLTTYTHQQRRKQNYTFRKDPVPYTGKGKWHNYCCRYRSAKVMQEKRLYDKQYGRPKRSPRMLPDTWDDIHRHTERCWKAQQKHRKQWMTNA